MLRYLHLFLGKRVGKCNIKTMISVLHNCHCEERAVATWQSL